MKNRIHRCQIVSHVDAYDIDLVDRVINKCNPAVIEIQSTSHDYQLYNLHCNEDMIDRLDNACNQMNVTLITEDSPYEDCVCACICTTYLERLCPKSM